MINGSRHCSFITFINTPDSCDYDQKQYKRVNNYLLAQKIGRGSYSKVYLGIDGDKKYAIKRISLTNLSRKSNGIMQLEREIRLMHKFNHNNILKIHEVLHSNSDNYVYLVLEYADCGSIGGIIDKGFHFQINSIRSIIKQISNALSHIHSLGFVHQDIKPANILLKSDGKVLLADFGIGHSFLSASTVVGTPAYQAPEAIVDNIELDDYDYDEPFPASNKYEDESYDESTKDETECPQLKEEIWALGVSLYQLIFNDLPYTGENLYEIVSTIKSTQLILPYQIDPQIEELLRKMLEVDPEKRISLDELMNDPFVKDAPDLVPENLSSYMPSESNDTTQISYNSIISDQKSNIIQIDAAVCNEDYSFAQAALSIQSKLQQIYAPYSFGESYHKSAMRSSSLMQLQNTNVSQNLTPKISRNASLISKSTRNSPHSVPINFSPQQSSFSLSDE